MLQRGIGANLGDSCQVGHKGKSDYRFVGSERSGKDTLNYALEGVVRCAAPGDERGGSRIRQWCCRPRWTPLANSCLHSLSPRELVSTEIYANAIVHVPNGRSITVVGDGD